MYWIIVAATCAFGGFFVVNGHRRRVLHNLIVNTRTTPVGRLREGRVEVKGQVLSTDPSLQSPFSGTPCAYFSFRVDELVSRNRSRRWVNRVTDTSDALALVRDETGEVEVDLRRAELHLARDHAGSRALFERNDERLREVLQARYGFDAKGLFFEKDLRFAEKVLEEGDEVYVLGTARRTADGRWVVEPGADGVLLVSDLQEETLAEKVAGSGWLWTFAGIACFFGAAVVAVAFGEIGF